MNCSVKITLRTLTRLDACDTAVGVVGLLLPATIYREPERNLPLALRLVDRYRCCGVHGLVFSHVHWLVCRLSPGLEDDADQAYAVITFEVVDVSLVAQMLAMVAERQLELELTLASVAMVAERRRARLVDVSTRTARS